MDEKQAPKILVQGGEPSGIWRFVRGLGKKTGPTLGLWQRVQFFGILVKNQFPAIFPSIVFQKVNIVIIGFDFEITRAFAIPPVDDVYDFVATIDEVEGDRPLVKLIA